MTEAVEDIINMLSSLGDMEVTEVVENITDILSS